MKARFILVSAVVLILGVTGVLLLRGRDSAVTERKKDRTEKTRTEVASKTPEPAKPKKDTAGKEEKPAAETGAASGEGNVFGQTAPQSEEKKREAEEERLVDTFDALTDKWMNPSKTGIKMKDVDEFAERFKALPKSRKEECLQRALNLVPDENVMLLAGILMDKSQDKELVQLVFNDVLNRDEDVKKPILLQIFKDKGHPCWADTAWILDVTGEMPKKK